MLFLLYISCFSSVIYLGTGIIVLITKINSPLHRNFFYFSLCFSIWAFSIFMLSSGISADSIFFTKLEYSVALTYGVFILRFIIILTSSIKSAIMQRIIFALLWIVPVIFLYQNVKYNMISNSFPSGFWYVGLHVFANIYNLAGVILLLFWAAKNNSRKIKLQVKIIVISGIVTIIITVIGDYISGFYGVPTPTPALSLLWIGALLLSIQKYRLLEISPYVITVEILNSIEENIVLFDLNKNIKWNNSTPDLWFKELLKQNNNLITMFAANTHGADLISELVNNEKTELSFRYPFRITEELFVYDIFLKAVFDSFGDGIGYLMKAGKVKSFDTLKIFYHITSREVEVIKLLITGMTYSEIADELQITENTLKTHITSSYNKFGINNKVELINIINKT